MDILILFIIILISNICKLVQQQLSSSGSCQSYVNTFFTMLSVVTQFLLNQFPKFDVSGLVTKLAKKWMVPKLFVNITIFRYLRWERDDLA